MKYQAMSGKGPLAPPKAAAGKKSQKNQPEASTSKKGKSKQVAPVVHHEEEDHEASVGKKDKKDKKGKKTIAKMGRDELKRRMTKVYEEGDEDDDEDEAGGDDDRESHIYVKKGDGKLGPSAGQDFDGEVACFIGVCWIFGLTSFFFVAQMRRLTKTKPLIRKMRPAMMSWTRS